MGTHLHPCTVCSWSRWVLGTLGVPMLCLLSFLGPTLWLTPLPTLAPACQSLRRAGAGLFPPELGQTTGLHLVLCPPANTCHLQSLGGSDISALRISLAQALALLSQLAHCPLSRHCRNSQHILTVCSDLGRTPLGPRPAATQSSHPIRTPERRESRERRISEPLRVHNHGSER